MTKYQSILARVKQHAGKPYLLNLSADATFALEYLLHQENSRIAESAGKRYLIGGKQKRVNSIQRPDIVSRALLRELNRYHEWEHNGDKDETHPAPELVGIVGADGTCPICQRIK